jgi:CMP-N,N'-diacetyllegionaminic acid synthase
MPLIGWAHAAARASRHLDRCILSTESEQIASIGSGLGMDVPFLRPASLAGDFVTNVDVALHAVAALEGGYDFVALLQPTSPFRTADDIDRCVESAVAAPARSAVSVRRFSPAETEDVARRIQMPGSSPREAADLRPNGAVYVVGVDVLVRIRNFVVAGTAAYEMPEARSIDIDSAADFGHAETIARFAPDRRAA